MIAIIRIRGRIEVDRDIRVTLDMLKLPTKFSMRIMDTNDSTRGMINTVCSYVAWGEVSQEIENMFKNKASAGKTICLKPPKGGLKAIKKPYPRGDLGYRGDKINDLIKRML